MPSFAYEVKSELANVSNSKKCCDIAQLNGMLKVGAKLNENKLEFISSNAAVARKVLQLIKKIYPQAQTEVAVIRNKRFRFRNQYIVRLFKNSVTKNIFKEMRGYKFPTNECCQGAYLRGLFLSCGSINKPEAFYHLEIFTESQEIAEFITKNTRRMGFSVNFFERKDRFVIYLKEFDMICDFLYVIGAKNTLERFEVAQNIKEIRANVNRLVNCETANMQRAINAAQKQLRDIKYLESTGAKLDDNLQEVADLRLKYPDLSINELAEKIYMSPSGFKRRMFQIHLLANPEEKRKYDKKMKLQKKKSLKKVKKSSKIAQSKLAKNSSKVAENKLAKKSSKVAQSKLAKNSSNGNP